MSGPPAPLTPRSRRAKRATKMLILLAGGLAIVAALAGAFYFNMRPVTLRVAVGPQSSDDLKVMQAVAQAFSRERNYIRLRVIPTDGTIASANNIASGTADVAVVRGDLDLPKEAMAVATLRKNVAVLWVPPQPKGAKKAKAIKKVEQLAGHRVGVIGRTAANVNVLKLILEQYGVPPDKVEIAQFSTTGFAEAIRNEKLDAFLAVGPLNSKITAEAIAATSQGAAPTFLAIDAADAIAQKRPAYEAAEIPAGTFGGAPAKPDDAVKTLGFNHYIVARKSLSEATVSAFTRQLFAVRQTVLNEFPLAAKLEAPDTDKDAAIPAHPGAAAYVDGEEKTFLDRYSDYIWWSLMGFSALGSAGAWFASYLKKDERITNSSRRDRLLEMIAVARKSGSPDELDEMQLEADEILRDTLNCFEHGVIEEGTLTAFNIALEQFHNAVADRKALLATLPPSSSTKQSVQLLA